MSSNPQNGKATRDPPASGPRFTAKQEAFIAWYVKLLNATDAAARAGYSADNRHALEQQASRLLRNVEIKAEIDKRIKASIPSADMVLQRIGQTAIADVTPYVLEDGRIDVQGLAAAGLGHLVIGSKPGRNGPEITLAHPQPARKMLARYHKLLGAQVEIDQSTTIALDQDAIGGLVEQLAAAAAQQQQASGTEQDDTE